MDKIVAASRRLAVIHALPWAAVALGGLLALAGAAYLTGLAQAVTGALGPKPSKVQQQQEQQQQQQVQELALSAPDVPPYR